MRRVLRLWGPALAAVPFFAGPITAEPPKPLANVNAERRVVAFIHGNVPVYRDELGEYLIARGGMEKVELLVNRRIIEVAAARANITVTPDEIKAGLEDDLRGAKVDMAAFTQFIKERYGKTLFEWEQDVIRPRLQLGKMCRGSITITPEDVQKTWESKFGEKREAQLIVWPVGKDAPPLSQQQKDAARLSVEEFEKLAAAQPDPGLAQARGRVNPVGRHIDGEDPNVEKALFSLKEGEISDWIPTKTSLTCVRLIKIHPADPNQTFDKLKGEVEKEVFDRKLNAAIPEMFTKLKKDANPQLTVQVPKPPVADPMNPPVRIEDPDPRVLAKVYGNILITREDLGDFLLVRGGDDKLELLVNKRIIEWEAAKRGITITPEELEKAKKDYVNKLGIANVTVADFVKHVLPKRNLTEVTWVEDIIKPELVMAKLCRERVKVTAEDLQQAFENKYGEKRELRLILWPRDQARVALKQWDEARKSDQDFDRIARSQTDPNLAAAGGKIEPMGRYPDADNPKIAEVAFSLKEGEVSQLFETPAGIICIKLIRKIPPVAGVSLDQVKETLTAEKYERKLSRELGLYFGELKAAANPNILLRSPTSSRDFEDLDRQLIQQVSGTKPK